MVIYGPGGKPLRSFGAFGLRRKTHLRKLQAGMMTCEPIVGKRGVVLVCEGEILSQKHIDQIIKLCDRPADGSLLLYTREIWVKTATGSVDLVPKCESDPYAAHSIQKLYKKGNKVTHGKPRLVGGTTYKMVDGKLTEIKK